MKHGMLVSIEKPESWVVRTSNNSPARNLVIESIFVDGLCDVCANLRNDGPAMIIGSRRAACACQLSQHTCKSDAISSILFKIVSFFRGTLLRNCKRFVSSANASHRCFCNNMTFDASKMSTQPMASGNMNVGVVIRVGK